MIEIAINQNMVLGEGTAITDKGGLRVVFSAPSTGTKSLLDIAADVDTIVDSDSSILLFPPNVTAFDKTAKTAADILGELKAVHLIFHKIFSLYDPRETVDKDFPGSIILGGLNLTAENVDTMLTQEGVVNASFKNIANAVSAYIKKHKVNEKEAFRIKFIRQSAKKPYPRFVFAPERDNWVELMSIPEAASKVKYTDYEISKGLDSALPVMDAPAADATTDATKAFDNAEAATKPAANVDFS